MLFSERIATRRQRWKIKKPAAVAYFNKTRSVELASKFGLYPPDTLHNIESIDSLPALDDLANSFVLKPVSGSNSRGVFVVTKGIDSFTGEKFSLDYAKNRVGQIKGEAIGTQFVVEERLWNWDGSDDIPYDFKFYTFGKNVAFFHVVRRTNKGNEHWFFKPDCAPLNMKIQRTQEHCSRKLELPDNINDMLHLASKMGKHLNMFIRIDLYATTTGIRFGEFTPFPHGGKGYTDDAEAWLGSLWKDKEGGQFSLIKKLRKYLFARNASR